MNAVKVLLDYGHYLILGMSAEDMTGLFRRWKSDSMTGMAEGTCTLTGVSWVFKYSEVVAMHTVRVTNDAAPIAISYSQTPSAFPLQNNSGVDKRWG